MKYFILFILFLFPSLSVCGQTINKQAEKGKTNVRLVDFTRHHFIKKWKNTANNAVYQRTATANNKYFERLANNPQRKLPLVPRKDLTGDDYLVDSAYYCKTIFSTKKYTLNIYKSGSKYKDKMGDEMFAPVDYLVFVTMDSQQRIVDYLVCYYNVHRLYESAERYFYMNNGHHITLINFYVDEIDTSFKGIQKYLINNQGKFVLLNKTNGHKRVTK
jgi:hypothetical protein